MTFWRAPRIKATVQDCKSIQTKDLKRVKMTEPHPPFQVKALYEYKSDFEDDLSFPVGQVITITEIEDDLWYSGEYNGKSGMFPKNFVEVIDAPKVPASRPERNVNAGSDLASHSIQQEKPAAAPIQKSEIQETVHKSEPNEPIPKSEPKEPIVSSPVKPSGGVFPNQKINDPYSVKKQFLATGKSSYVPKVTPRDDSKVTSHASHDTPTSNTEIVKGTSFQEESVDEPKISLKERIALLHKRQQEETEREAASIKKQEEKKKKVAENKHKDKESGAHVETHSTGGSVHEEEPHRRKSIDSMHSYTSEHTSEAPTRKSLEATDLQTKASQIQEEEKDTEESEDAPNDDIEEEAESDDEELKRRKLVERMAKISGGRNMFGMMGMATPFGAPTSEKPSHKKSEKETKEPSLNRSNSTREETIPKSAPAIPSGPPSRPDALNDDDSSSDEEPFQQVSPPKRESSSMEEDDELTESDGRFPEVGNVQIHPESIDPLSPQTPKVNPSDSGLDEPDKDDEIKITRQPIEMEGTGYEADEDLSDLGKTPHFQTEDLTATSSQLFSPLASLAPVPPSPPIDAPSIPSRPPPPPVPQFAETPKIPEQGPPVPHSLRPPPPPVPQFAETPKIPEQGPPVPHSLRPPPPPVPQFAETPKIPEQGPPVPLSLRPPPIPTSVPLSTSTIKTADGIKPSLPEFDIPPPRTRVPSITPGFPPVAAPHLEDEDDENYEANRSIIESDEGLSEVHISGVSRSQTLPSGYRPPIPGSIPPVPGAPPIPGQPPKRASTDIGFSGDNVPATISRNSTGASDSLSRRYSTESITRSKSLSQKGQERNQADIALQELEFELGNISGNSSWWLKGELPESLAQVIGSDLVYEIDSNKIVKRGGRTINYRDYYVLFYDLSQLVFELEYDSEDPRSTIKCVNFFSKPIPHIRKDLLDKYHRINSQAIVSYATSLLGSKIHDDIVSEVLNNASATGDIILPIGHKSYGVTIYKNIGNSNVAKIDDIRPGDLLWVKNGKFVSHKGIIGNKSVVLGEGAASNDTGGVYTSIIYEYDPRKEKFKVIELDVAGNVKKEAYKISDMKSGRIRVFRVVGKDYVEW